MRIQEVTPEIAESLGLSKAEGALVANLTPGGPAEKIGIRQGDVIEAFGGHDIISMHDLPHAVAEAPVGERVNVKVWRSGREVTLSRTIMAMSNNPEPSSSDTLPTQPPARASEWYVLSLENHGCYVASSIIPRFTTLESFIDGARSHGVLDHERSGKIAGSDLSVATVVIRADGSMLYFYFYPNMETCEQNYAVYVRQQAVEDASPELPQLTAKDVCGVFGDAGDPLFRYCVNKQQQAKDEASATWEQMTPEHQRYCSANYGRVRPNTNQQYTGLANCAEVWGRHDQKQRVMQEGPTELR